MNILSKVFALLVCLSVTVTAALADNEMTEVHLQNNSNQVIAFFVDPRRSDWASRQVLHALIKSGYNTEVSINIISDWPLPMCEVKVFVGIKTDPTFASIRCYTEKTSIMKTINLGKFQSQEQLKYDFSSIPAKVNDICIDVRVENMINQRR